MRVITGTARGRSLQTLPGEDVRPTTDRVKEAMFSIIQFEVEGSQVLDLFAGSGQLGIEALSRGAAYATFVDSAKESIECIKFNLQKTNLKTNSCVVQTDAYSFLKTSAGSFDIALLDPPYSKGLLQKALPLVALRMNANGVIICEHPYGEEMPEAAGDFKLYREYKYGKLALTVYRIPEGDEE
ncbi:MAG: 16S rRNA (guanine(966)-N(2))-methyltransferase RsmD [Clostridia bacterium]|nr:16S rRNA (guanine(966)-N(2))-methyltransferase RsmD [Clostridia bacterium]